MNLRELAEQDLAFVLEDDASGFGWPITLTDPTGTSASMTGRSTDISQVIDPDTGQAVSGRAASVAIRISTLTAKGLGLPKSINSATMRPWTVQFDDINGAAYKFKVQQSNPDRAVGIVTCILEAYT